MRFNAKKKETLDCIFHSQGYTDYKWIDPTQIVVAQWVSMKCMFGCDEYGRDGTCPPNTPSVAECERFFKEYTQAVILHVEGQMDQPEDRHSWSAKINARLIKLEREVFLAGCEQAFLLFMDACCFCRECTGDRRTCSTPRMDRPSPEAMSVDVYSTVRRFGFPISVRTAYDQKMDRYAFLMVH